MTHTIEMHPEHGYSFEYLRELLTIDFLWLRFFGAFLLLLGLILFGYSMVKGKEIRKWACCTMGIGLFFAFFEEILNRICSL